MIGTYFYLRFKNLQWPPPGMPEPKVLVPLVLLARARRDERSRAARGARGRAGRLRAVRGFLLLALVVQAAYFAMAVHEYARRPEAVRAAGSTRTARSTTRCSAPTTRTSGSGSCSARGCSRSSRAG